MPKEGLVTYLKQTHTELNLWLLKYGTAELAKLRLLEKSMSCTYGIWGNMEFKNRGTSQVGMFINWLTFSCGSM